MDTALDSLDFGHPPMRVLVVDNDRDNTDSLCALIRSRGHESLGLYYPKTVFEAAPLLRPDLMLIDLAMPRFNGIDLVRRLRDDSIVPDAAMIAMSGYVTDAFRDQAVDLGFDDFLAKPFGLDQLEAIIADLDGLKLRSKGIRDAAHSLAQQTKAATERTTQLIQDSQDVLVQWRSLIAWTEARIKEEDPG
jgi:CheY-like chemotaxis protein